MFRFVVSHLRWLARVPGLPQFFDALLLVWTSLVHRERLAAMEMLEAAAMRLTGMQLRVHRLGGVEFTLCDCELGHLHGNGLLDVRVGRECARALVGARRAEFHHVFGESAWISFWLRTSDDVTPAMDLLKTAAGILPNAA